MRHLKGFSLLELAIALTILGVILYQIVTSQTGMRDFDHHKDNQVLMEHVQSAFNTFVQVNGFLPCPDINGDGRQNRAIASPFECSGTSGRVPYLDLGITSEDEWWGTLFYAVNQAANNPTALVNNNNSASYFNNLASPNASFDLNTPPLGALGGAQAGSGNYVICSESASACNASTSNIDIIEHSAIAVIVSFGKNSNLTWNGNLSQLSSIEQENRDDDSYYWQAQWSTRSNQEFDDQLFWLTGFDLKYAIVRSEKGLADLP